ncbi:MAG: (d)CMP kinase [Candidatus Omnitrophica bacterium]|nr:(d)CMP kinase [Candidatus Omnitrophota bacterium]
MTLDGPAGCGKSTAASSLAKRLGFLYLDTGAMYRALALKSLRLKIGPMQERRLGQTARTTNIDLKIDPGRVLRVLLDGRDVMAKIRTAEVAERASEIATIAAVRRAMVRQQRRIGRRGRVVAEGRDTGTVVFPDAPWKFFMTASLKVRAERRRRDLSKAGHELRQETVIEQVRQRDLRDRTRAHSPLRPAAGAVRVDTSRRTKGQTLKTLLSYIKRHSVKAQVPPRVKIKKGKR